MLCFNVKHWRLSLNFTRQRLVRGWPEPLFKIEEADRAAVRGAVRVGVVESDRNAPHKPEKINKASFAFCTAQSSVTKCEQNSIENQIIILLDSYIHGLCPSL
jgi:hypothetical protein